MLGETEVYLVIVHHIQVQNSQRIKMEKIMPDRLSICRGKPRTLRAQYLERTENCIRLCGREM